jgi:thiol-disulfide isomerase/thioredoxin
LPHFGPSAKFSPPASASRFVLRRQSTPFGSLTTLCPGTPQKFDKRALRTFGKMPFTPARELAIDQARGVTPTPRMTRGAGTTATNPRRDRMVRFAAAALALAASLQSFAAFGNEILMLDFWSPTCGPCMQMKPTVQSLINAGYPIRQVDVSREPQLARDYHVTGIPCFVMLVDGQEVGRIVGSTSSDQLVELFRGGRLRAQSPSGPPPAAPADLSRIDHAAPADPLVAEGPGATPPSAGFGAVPPDNAHWTQQLDSKLLSSAVRLRVEDAKGLSHGTGTIIDAREGEALLITCGHIFRESKGKGPVTVDLFEATAQGLRVVDKVSGEVIVFDLERDVALVSFRPNRPVCVAAVAAAHTPIARGDRAASVGCSNAQDPSVLATRVTWLDRYQGPPNIETSGAPVEGRSGGGLFNDKGELIGVCFAADLEGNKGLYAGLDSIHEMLRQLKLDGQQLVASDGPSPQNAAAGEPLVRGQEPPAAVPIDASTPPTNAIANTSLETSAAASQPLEPKEQAMLEEIGKRLDAGYEVVCIVRPKEPGGQSEVITLNGVSPEFVRSLADRPKSPQAPTTR